MPRITWPLAGDRPVVHAQFIDTANVDPTLESEIRKTRSVVIVNDDAIGTLPLCFARSQSNYGKTQVST